jgi:acyl carrier protein
MNAEIVEKLAECLRNVNDQCLKLDVAGSLRDMNLDSMEIVNFFLEVESCFNVALPQEEIDGHNLYAVRNLADYLSSKK